MTNKFNIIFMYECFDIFINTRSLNEGRIEKNHNLDSFSEEDDPRLKVHTTVKKYSGCF